MWIEVFITVKVFPQMVGMSVFNLDLHKREMQSLKPFLTCIDYSWTYILIWKKYSKVFITFILPLGITFQEVQLLLEVRKENLITQLRSQ